MEEVIIFGNGAAAGTYTVDSTTGPQGDDGDNFVVGGTAAEAEGGAGDDYLVSGELKAGNGQHEGEFTITQSGTATSFVFNFEVSRGPVFASYADWALDNLGVVVGDNMTQSAFATSYTSWLNALVSELSLGSDLDGDGKISVNLNQNDPNGTPLIEGMSDEQLNALFADAASIDVKTGKTTQERWYSDLDTSGGFQILNHDGNDTVLNFDVDGDDHDVLDLRGVTAEEALQYFNFATADVDADGKTDTVISWDGGSITLLGVETYTSMQSMVDEGLLLFG